MAGMPVRGVFLCGFGDLAIHADMLAEQAKAGVGAESPPGVNLN